MSASTSIKKILILCSRLDMPGGIERSVVNISNLLSDEGHHVSILVLDEVDTVFYTLNKEVQVHHLNLQFGIAGQGSRLTRKLSFVSDVRRLRQFLMAHKPEVLLATEYPFTIGAWLASRSLPLRVFSREAFHFHGLEKSKFWQKLIRWVYPKLNGVVCLNTDEEKHYRELGCRTIMIPNYVRPQPILNQKRENLLLTVCRFSQVKGADMIPQIAERVFQKVQNWRWLIIGEGVLEEELRMQIQRLNLQEKVLIVPPTKNDLGYSYRTASLYVSTSRMEGFPNVLLEAMAHHLPCISFDCPTGPRHIIETDVNGLLVPTENIVGMANEIIRLIEDPAKRYQLAENARSGLAQFSPEKVYKLWEQLISPETKN